VVTVSDILRSSSWFSPILPQIVRRKPFPLGKCDFGHFQPPAQPIGF